MAATRLLVVLLVAGLACGGTARLPPPANRFPARIYTLPSGLRVVVGQDEASGVVGVVWVVDAGETDDPPGKPGVAHLVEHLLFDLPDQTGVPTWDRLMALAAQGQAWTSSERMDLFAFGPARALDDLVAVVLARAANPLGGANDTAIARARQVIAEELELRHATPDDEGPMRVLSTLTVAGHRPRPSFEEMNEVLATISRHDLDAFVEQRYLPRYMTLVVSGAIPPDWDKELLARLPPSLAGLPSQRVAPERRPLVGVGDSVPAQAAIESVPAPVGARELWIGWRLPPARGTVTISLKLLDAIANAMLEGVLGTGFLSGVVHAEALTSPSSFGSTLLFRLVLDPRADPVLVRDHAVYVGTKLGQLSGSGLPDGVRHDLELGLRQGVLQSAFDLESPVERTLLRAELAHYDPGASLTGTIEALADTSLDEFAGPWIAQLQRPPYRSVLLTPAAATEGGARPVRAHTRPVDFARGGAGLTGEGGTPESHAAPLSPGEIAAIAHAPGASSALVTQLPSGLTIIALRRPSLPLVSMFLGFHADAQLGDVAGQRIGALLGRKDDVKLGPRARNLLQDFHYDNDSYREKLRLFSSNTASALQLLAEEADKIGVSRTADLDRWVAKTAQEEKTPDARAWRSYSDALWGNHVYGREETSDAARLVSPAQIRRWLGRVRRPANGVLVVVGDIDPPAFTRQAASALARWRGDPSRPPPPPSPAPVPPAEKRQRLTVLFTPDPAASIGDVRFGCLFPAVREHRDILPGALLGRVFDAELSRTLFAEMGAGYAHSVRTFYSRGGTFYLEGQVDLDERALPRALEVLRAWLASEGSASVEPGMFERERWRLASRSALKYQTSTDIAGALFDAWNMGWPPEALDAFPREIASVTLGDVQAALRACRASAVVSIVAGGQPPASESR